MAVLSELIRHDKPLRTGATAVYPFKPNLERKYRFMSRFGDEVLLHRVEGKVIHLPRALCPVGQVDERVDGEAADFPKAPAPRPHQVKLFDETARFLKQGLSGIVSAYTGWGKCLAPHEPVIMFDGSVKLTRDLKVGDLLMGPDSKPRTVLATNPGRGPMYRVIPNKGEPFECNDVHILSLKCTSDCHYGRKGEVVNVPLNEWLIWPDGKKHVFKLWRTGVEFPESKQRIDAYFLGVLLGDGGMRHSINVTTMDAEIVAEIRKQAAIYGASIREDSANTGAATTYFLSGARGNANRCALRFELECLGLTQGEKFVPAAYKVASREQRLQLLAGLLDTDGYLNAGVFEITSKSGRLADDIVFVARSLGFGVSRGVKTVNGAAYARITIYGDTHLIPTRLPRKQAAPRTQKKNVLLTGFRVEEIGEGNWFGIQLDDDHLYLLKDFTVTHNTVLGYHAAVVVGRKTLVITTKDDIYKQWIEGAKTFLGLAPHEIGEIRGDKCEVVGTKFVVAMIHSLSKDGKYPDWIGQGFGLVIFDEVHRVPAEQFSNVVDMFPARLRLGLSATPERADGKELLVLSHIGPIRAKTEAQLMVPKVLRFLSTWDCPRVLRADPESGQRRVVRLPHEPGKTAHVEKIVAADPVRNHMLAELIHAAYEKNRQLVVFSTLHEHLRSLHRACHATFGISGRKMGFYIGAQTKAEREQREREKVKPILFTTYTMMGEGTSIDWLDACLLAMPRANVTQPVGRIRREFPDKGEPVVLDVVDQDSPVFSGYAASRLRWYESIGAVVKDMN